MRIGEEDVNLLLERAWLDKLELVRDRHRHTAHGQQAKDPTIETSGLLDPFIHIHLEP